MEKKKVIKYSNNEVTVVWQPHLCTHAGNCVKALPNVYKPTQKPWLNPENATGDELIAQVKTYPSGALSCE